MNGGPYVESKASASALRDAFNAREASVYVAALQRYLGTSADNSLGSGSFETVYVLDRAAYPDAAHPSSAPEPRNGNPIRPDVQRRITAALAGTTDLTFVADRGSVVEDPKGCATVKNGGVLVTLGTLVGEGDEEHVAVSGFVTCLRATWLTYVVHRAGTGWTVTGTTGPYAVA